MTNPIRSNSQRVPAQQAGNNEQAGQGPAAQQRADTAGPVAQQRANIARQRPVAQQRANQPPGNIQNMDRLKEYKKLKRDLNTFVKKANAMLKIFRKKLPANVSNGGQGQQLPPGEQRVANIIHPLIEAIRYATAHQGIEYQLVIGIRLLERSFKNCKQDETLGPLLKNELVKQANAMLEIIREELPANVVNAGLNLVGLEQLPPSERKAARNIDALYEAIECAATHQGDTSYLEADIELLERAIERCEDDEILGALL